DDDQEGGDLLSLQRAAYSVEAAIIGSTEIPALRDTVATLQACGESFWGYFDEGRLTGAISYRRLGDTLDIHRLVVHPTQFRQGIARKLLRFVEAAARAARLQRIIVSTGAANTPACALYLSEGFDALCSEEAAPGLRITRFAKHIASGEDAQRTVATGPAASLAAPLADSGQNTSKRALNRR